MPAQAQAKRRSAPQPEEKPAKRTRVSRACDQCRVAREKCDGVQPTCSTCSGTSRECSYTANPKKRGIQPGYIRTLELALAYLFQQNPENETALNEKLAQGGPSSLLLGRGDSKESNKLHRRWRKAKFYTDVDRLLSGGETSRHEQTAAASPHTSDEGSGVEEAFAAHASRTQDHVGYPQDDIESPSLGQLVGAPPGPLVEETISTTMPPDSWKLLEVYFANIQSWLPICEKHDILKTAYDYPTQGLSSKSNRPDSGLYAELWSVLAVASLYGVSTTNHDPLNSSSARPVKLYESAKSLVPNELDRFDMGYIKALLNLVVFNMARGQSGEAWLLVGCASRVLESVNQLTLMGNPRHKHVYYGCFLLDSMLALQLKRRPHFRRSDLEHLGTIDEDGLEEWQPWSGFLDPSHAGRRAPLLSLSIFNSVIELVDLLISIEQPSTRHIHKDAVECLERWRAMLPTKLAHICTDNGFSVLTPPAALLLATYHYASFACSPSDASFHRLLDVLDRCFEHPTSQCLPPTIRCLLDVANRQAARLVLHDVNRMRLERLRERNIVDFNAQHQTQVLESTVMPLRQHTTDVQMSSAASLQTLFSDTYPIAQPAAPPHHAFFPGPSHSQIDPRCPEPTSDLESFFDELASLDSATRSDTQPQFMQNLGFGPDASMADLFSEYIPMQSSSFITRDESAPANLDQYNFYDAS
jgi:hypothetical protein